ncbi:PcfK-like family protein [Danxiaibacter flavus]|uniref:PcfK-like family protein n=1 Tax=Danxiaibacter flavus TaxID=3049108 RepID=A0ABV3ZQG5_9BACT|nr:PcfK-like family protein [Chitinophagaceae bacterium DXS]
MKGTESFKSVIQNYLNSLAAKDPLFSETFKKANKNIDDCITYILNTVKESGCNGFADEEIFNLAVHYYDEDNIKPGDKIEATVVVNHHAQLTEEEVKAAKEEALQKVIAEETNRIKKKSPSKVASKETETKSKELLLFE